LNLRHTNISDLGLAHLMELTALQNLLLPEGRITEQGLENLQLMMPRVEIQT